MIALRFAPRSEPFKFGMIGVYVDIRDYVMNDVLSPVAMGRVGRPFEGRKREQLRRQARIDRHQVGKKEQVRFTISVEKHSREWSLIEPRSNKSEFIRQCVREYPTLSRKVRELMAENDILETQVEQSCAAHIKAMLERDRLRKLLEEHSVVIE